MKRVLSLLLVGGAALLSSGCMSLPVAGLAGFAEHRLEKLRGDVVGPADGLKFELELLARHLDVLVLEGAELCFPATVVQARQRQDRIARELGGGLDLDAANDIIVQRNLLFRLERQLDYVVKQQACTLPQGHGEHTPGDIGSRIHDLLNRDNQFAVDSAELNPRYAGHLAEAAGLLRERPGYRLRITGHADAVGPTDHNRALSRARAEQVARYLRLFGLDESRITVDAVGSDSPLFAGLAPHNRLVNRRVSVELVEDTRLAGQAGAAR